MEGKLESSMRKDNGTRNLSRLKKHYESIPGFHRFLKQICDQLQDEGLLDLKQANRFMERPDEDLVKFKKLVHMFMDKGTKSLEFLFVLGKVKNYPEFSRHVQTIIDDFVDSLKANVSHVEKNNTSKKRSNDETAEYESTKRSKSEMNMNSVGIVLRVKQDASQNTEQKALNRWSCPAEICIEVQTLSNKQEDNVGIPLQEIVTHDDKKSKLDHMSISMPPMYDQMASKSLLSDSKENLSDVENVKALEEISAYGKIKKKKKKSFAKKLRSFGVIVLGAVAAVAYVMPRSAELAHNSSLANVTKNATQWEKIGPAEIVDTAIKTVESKVGNSSMNSYRFTW